VRADSARTGPPQAYGERLDFVQREHERRDIEAGLEAVADARLALDRHAREREVAHIAVHRAQRHAEPLREERGRRQATAAQVLDDAEQAVGAPHGPVQLIA